jgi:7-keto-8-aminopelargonate synthetase-like enzyme
MSVTTLIAHLTDQIPQTNLVVERQEGRRLLIGGRWITDFGSLNYLGLDLNPEVIASVQPMLKEWGTHPSWTRAVASPAPYMELERELAALVGAPEVLVFPTITLLHLGVLPLLAGSEGTILVDEGSHKSIREAAELATARGAKIVPVRRSDAADLERQLQRCDPRSPRVITVNGVYSMPGTLPDIPGYADLARRYNATLYIDDAHGIGVLGEHPHAGMPYGSGGGGVVRYFGLGYDHIVYVAGLSKAFSSLGAFVTCRSPSERTLFLAASTMIFSGPVPVASLATALAGLRINRQVGDIVRSHVHRLTMRIIRGAREAGLVVENEIGFPALTVVIGGIEQVVDACRIAWEHGILFTPAAFPAMPLERGGLRLSVTAANTDADVDRLLVALDDIATRVTDRTSLSPRH